MFRPVERARAFEHVVEQVERAIVGGELQPGDYLPSERSLVDEFRVGRSTVREALRVLEGVGLVEVIPGSPKGPRVAQTAGLALGRVIRGLVHVEGIQQVDIVEYRMMMGSTCNLLAAHLRTDEHLAKMRTALDHMRSCLDADDEEFAQADLQFHAVIAEAAGNALMSQTAKVINKLAFEMVTDTIRATGRVPAIRESFIQVHEEVHNAIANRDGDLAATLSRTTLFKYYGNQLSDDDKKRLRLLMQTPERDDGEYSAFHATFP